MVREVMADLETILARRPSAAAWRDLCDLLDSWPTRGLTGAIARAAAALEGWPDLLRVAPDRWWADRHAGRPQPRLALARVRPLWSAGGDDDDDDDDAFDLGIALLDVDVAPDHRTFVLADAAEWHHNGGDVALLDTLGRRPTILLSGARYHGECSDTAYSRDGRLFAASPVHDTIDGEVRVWTVATRKLSWKHSFRPRRALDDDDDDDEFEALEGFDERILLDFSADGRTLIGASMKLGALFFWNARTGRMQARIDDGGAFTALRVSPDGRWLAAGTRDGVLKVWSLAGRTLHGEDRIGRGPVWAVGFTGDSKTVVGGGAGLERWQLGRRGLVGRSTLAAARGRVLGPGDLSLAPLPGGHVRYARLEGRQVVVTDLPSGASRALRLPARPSVVRLARDGRSVVVGDDDAVRLWLLAPLR